MKRQDAARKAALKRRRESDRIAMGKRRDGRMQGWEKLLRAGLMCAELGLTIYQRVQNRREVLHAVEQGEDILLLAREQARPVTREPEAPKPPEKAEKQG